MKKTSEEESLESIENQLLHLGMTYILMKLSIDENSQRLEDLVKRNLTEESSNAFVRKARIDDLNTILNLYNKAWSASQTPLSIITYDALKEIFESPYTVIFITQYKGFDVGFIIIDQEKIEKGIGTIEGLGINPRFQGKGFGRKLGLAAWEYFKRKDVKELRCEVYEDNIKSYEFIKSLGFIEYDRKVYHLDDFFL